MNPHDQHQPVTRRISHENHNDPRKAIQDECLPCFNYYLKSYSSKHINDPLPGSYMNALHWAIVWNKVELMNYFTTTLGANINARVSGGEYNGKRPLYIAVYNLPRTQASFDWLMQHPQIIKDPEALTLHQKKIDPPVLQASDPDASWVDAAPKPTIVPRTSSWTDGDPKGPQNTE